MVPHNWFRQGPIKTKQKKNSKKHTPQEIWKKKSGCVEMDFWFKERQKKNPFLSSSF